MTPRSGGRELRHPVMLADCVDSIEGVFTWTVELAKPSYSHLGHPHATPSSNPNTNRFQRHFWRLPARPVPVLRLARQNVTTVEQSEHTTTYLAWRSARARVACALKRRAFVHVHRLHAAPMERDSPGFLFILSLREHSDTTHGSCDALLASLEYASGP